MAGTTIDLSGPKTASRRALTAAGSAVASGSDRASRSGMGGSTRPDMRRMGVGRNGSVNYLGPFRQLKAACGGADLQILPFSAVTPQPMEHPRMERSEYDETRATARLPNLDIE